MKSVVATVFSLLALTLVAFPQQSSSSWLYTKQQDPLHGTSFDTFSLTGTYLNFPEVQKGQSPRIVVLCSRGKFTQAYLDTGMVIEPAQNSLNGGLAHSLKGAIQAEVEIRKDDKKPGTSYWEITNNSRALSLDATQLSELLTGHLMGTEKDWSHPVRRLIFGVVEFGGNEIEMQFYTPDAEADAPLALACGLEVKGSAWRGYHKVK